MHEDLQAGHRNRARCNITETYVPLASWEKITRNVNGRELFTRSFTEGEDGGHGNRNTEREPASSMIYSNRKFNPAALSQRKLVAGIAAPPIIRMRPFPRHRGLANRVQSIIKIAADREKDRGTIYREQLAGNSNFGCFMEEC